MAKEVIIPTLGLSWDRARLWKTPSKLLASGEGSELALSVPWEPRGLFPNLLSMSLTLELHYFSFIS